MINILNRLTDNRVIEIADKQEPDDKYLVCFYVLEDGTIPAKEFLSGLISNKAEKRIAAKLMYYLVQRIKKGQYPKSPEHYYYFNEHGFFELKAYQGRLFCFFDGKLCITVYGWRKKSQKTPQRVIDKVNDYKEEYYRRKKNLAKRKGKK